MNEPPSDPLPRRVAWFAPWTWRPWKRRALASMLLVGYPLSIGPLIWLNERKLVSPSARCYRGRLLAALICRGPVSVVQ